MLSAELSSSLTADDSASETAVDLSSDSLDERTDEISELIRVSVLKLMTLLARSARPANLSALALGSLEAAEA